jgi:hypothetical protein
MVSFIQSADSATLRDDLLRIHATLLPKTILMDYKFGQNLENNTILIGLLCRKTDIFSAQKLRRYILEKYKDGIKGMSVDVKIINYNEVDRKWPSVSLYYFFPAAPQQIRAAMKKIKKKRIVFVYDPQDLMYGAHIGLQIGRQIKPVLNVDALKANDITLRPALVRISALYYQGKPSVRAGD